MSQPPPVRRLGPINLPPPPPPSSTPPPALSQQSSPRQGIRPLTSKQLGMTVIPKRTQKTSTANLYQIPPNVITSAPATPLTPIVPIPPRLPSPPRHLNSRPKLVNLPVNLPSPDLMYDQYKISPVAISSNLDSSSGYLTTQSNLVMLGDPVSLFEYFKQFNSVDEFFSNLPDRPYPQLVDDNSIFLFNNFNSSPHFNIQIKRDSSGSDRQIVLS